MWFLRCCFSGEVIQRPAGCSYFADKPSCAAPDTQDSGPALYEDASVEQGLGGSRVLDGADEGGISGVWKSPNYTATIAVDTAPLDTPCLPPSRWSDFGSRPELEALCAPRPFLSINHGSFSKPTMQPESVNLDSNNSLGGYISGILAMLPSGRQPQGERELRCSTIAQLVGATSSASWVGQGAQGAVVKAQWRSGGCTVAVKWLVTDAVNVPAAYMEALLAKMLAHPFLVQTFDCTMCQLDENFEQVNYNRGHLASPSRPVVAAALGTLAAAEARNLSLHADHLSVATALDSFEGAQAEGVGPRPVDCVEVLKQLGAAPGKYVVQIVSEWCDEGTLHVAIRKGVFRAQGKRTRTWALRALLRTAREVAQGMCHLHSLNIIHGDLKPGNVLLKSSRIDSRGFVAKVADFGLSRLCGRHEQYVATADWGTVPYMAGEYLDNKLCKSSDVYSFGVLLWQMYTGKAPFAGHHEAQVAVGVMLGNLQLEWPTNMPPPLRRLGQSCCRHQPDQRPMFKECVVALDGIEVQVRELAANVKARYAAIASQHSATASQGPNTTPAAPCGAQEAMLHYTHMRCSSLDLPADPCAAADTPLQSFTHSSYVYGCSGGASVPFSTVDGMTYSPYQPDAAGLAAINAFSANALAMLPDGTNPENLTGASGYSAAEPAAASHDTHTLATATSGWSSHGSHMSPAAAVGVAVQELRAAGGDLWFPSHAGCMPQGPLRRAAGGSGGGGRTPWPSTGSAAASDLGAGAAGTNPGNSHCALFGASLVIPIGGVMGPSTGGGGDADVAGSMQSLRLWSSAGPCADRDTPPRPLIAEGVAHAAVLHSPGEASGSSVGSSSCFRTTPSRRDGAYTQRLSHTRTTPGRGSRPGAGAAAAAAACGGALSYVNEGNGAGLPSPSRGSGGEPGFGYRTLPGSNSGNVSPSAWSHHVRAQQGNMPASATVTTLRTASRRGSSVGPVLQHVPEDDGDAGGGFASEVEDIPLACGALRQHDQAHQQ